MRGHHVDFVSASFLQDLRSRNKALHVINDVILWAGGACLRGPSSLHLLQNWTPGLSPSTWTAVVCPEQGRVMLPCAHVNTCACSVRLHRDIRVLHGGMGTGQKWPVGMAPGRRVVTLNFLRADLCCLQPLADAHLSTYISAMCLSGMPDKPGRMPSQRHGKPSAKQRAHCPRRWGRRTTMMAMRPPTSPTTVMGGFSLAIITSETRQIPRPQSVRGPGQTGSQPHSLTAPPHEGSIPSFHSCGVYCVFTALSTRPVTFLECVWVSVYIHACVGVSLLSC